MNTKLSQESLLREKCSKCKVIPELRTIIVRMKVITAAVTEHPSCISWELQSNGASCLCRFLHSLAAAGSSGWNSGLCVWSDVDGYQHTSVSLHAVCKTCLMRKTQNDLNEAMLHDGHELHQFYTYCSVYTVNPSRLKHKCSQVLLQACSHQRSYKHKNMDLIYMHFEH